MSHDFFNDTVITECFRAAVLDGIWDVPSSTPRQKEDKHTDRFSLTSESGSREQWLTPTAAFPRLIGDRLQSQDTPEEVGW